MWIKLTDGSLLNLDQCLQIDRATAAVENDTVRYFFSFDGDLVMEPFPTAEAAADRMAGLQEVIARGQETRETPLLDRVRGVRRNGITRGSKRPPGQRG